MKTKLSLTRLLGKILDFKSLKRDEFTCSLYVPISLLLLVLLMLVAESLAFRIMLKDFDELEALHFILNITGGYTMYILGYFLALVPLLCILPYCMSRKWKIAVDLVLIFRILPILINVSAMCSLMRLQHTISGLGFIGMFFLTLSIYYAAVAYVDQGKLNPPASWVFFGLNLALTFSLTGALLGKVIDLSADST